MPVKTEQELSEPLRAHWLKAVAAIELQNFEYAISLLQSLLKEEPEFLTARQVLRRAAIAKHQNQKRTLMRISTTAIAVFRAQRELKKDPPRAVEMIEKILANDPRNRQANLVLKEAAVAAGWPEIGVLALRTLLEGEGSDRRILHELGRLYREMGESEREAEVYGRIVEIDPTDAEANKLCKAASARASIKAGGWDRAESYRDVIKGKGNGAR